MAKKIRNKSDDAGKSLKGGDPLGFYNISIPSVAKHQKRKGAFSRKISKKPHDAKKTERGTRKSRPVLYITLKKGRTFLVQFHSSNGSI